jgi:katanin p80 WD40 repeat-containing subunit B1
LVPSTPQRAGFSSNNRSVGNSTFQSGGTTTTLKRSSLRSNSASNVHNFSKADIVPVIVPRASSGGELVTGSRSDAGDVAPVLPKVTRRADPSSDSRKESNDVEPVIPRASSTMEIASDSAPISTSKSGRRLEAAPDSKKESADTATAVPNPRANARMEMASDSAPALLKANKKLDSGTDSKKESADAVPVILISDSRREPSAGRVSPFRIQSRYAELRKLAHAKIDRGSKTTGTDDFNCQIFLPRKNGVFQTISSEETRKDVKCGPVDRTEFSNSSEPNASVRSENCMICTHLYVLCAPTTFIHILFHNCQWFLISFIMCFNAPTNRATTFFLLFRLCSFIMCYRVCIACLCPYMYVMT